jgi:hypothetical protein
MVAILNRLFVPTIASTAQLSLIAEHAFVLVCLGPSPANNLVGGGNGGILVANPWGVRKWTRTN